MQQLPNFLYLFCCGNLLLVYICGIPKLLRLYQTVTLQITLPTHHPQEGLTPTNTASSNRSKTYIFASLQTGWLSSPRTASKA